MISMRINRTFEATDLLCFRYFDGTESNGRSPCKVGVSLVRLTRCEGRHAACGNNASAMEQGRPNDCANRLKATSGQWVKRGAIGLLRRLEMTNMTRGRNQYRKHHICIGAAADT